MTSARYSSLDIADALHRHRPTEEQRRIIEAPPGPMLVVAGAGSGKTETMAARVVWLVANGLVDADAVLGLTFTRKAAGELSARIGARLRALRQAGLWQATAVDGEDYALPTVSTYHAYAGRLVSDHGLRLGLEPGTRLLTEAASWQYAAEVVESWNGDMSCVDKAVSTITEAVVSLSGELAEHLVTPSELIDWLDQQREQVSQERPKGNERLRKHPGHSHVSSLDERRAIAPIVQAYAELKRRRDAMDFADQMALAARLAMSVPMVGSVERQRFQAVLLDEFQDSSDAQLILLRSLFIGPEGPGNVTAVGDPNQSIYGWRGASATTLARMPRDFALPDGPAPVHVLTTSWRNDRAVLAVANTVAEPLRASLTVPVGELIARPGAGSGTVSVARLRTTEDEAALVASRIAAAWWTPSGRWTKRTAAVLCRKRSQFPMIVQSLEDQGLPVEIVGLGGLLLTPEVIEIVALLTVVHDPTRGDALMRLLTGPVCRLGAADLDGLHAWARHLQPRPTRATHEPIDRSRDGADLFVLSEALDRLPPEQWRGPQGQHVSSVALERLSVLARVIRDVRSLSSVTLTELLVEVERQLGLDVEVLARPGMSPHVARAHLDAFHEVAGDFSAAAERVSLGSFLAWLDAARDRERGLDLAEAEPAKEAVQVLTIHAAKGLEWSIVAVPGLVEGGLPENGGGTFDPSDGVAYKAPKAKAWTTGISLLPYPLRRDKDGLPALDLAACQDWQQMKEALDAFELEVGAHELTEERRLAYVAYTRAKDELLLTAAIWGDGKRPRVHSRYLDEVREAGVEVLHWEPAPDPEADNPREHAQAAASWPVPLPAQRIARLRQAAALVQEASMVAQVASRTSQGQLWIRDAHQLLAERAQRQSRTGNDAELPRHLSTSALVSLAGDRDAFALDLRRPVPTPPSGAARRGTAFHGWVEEHYARAAIVDLSELPGSADADALPDADLPRMQELFLASEWASRTPVEVESFVETVVDGIALRARIDAVFADDDGGYTVVDWKTGAEPTGEQARVRALQLGVYALAFARRRDIDPEQVRAAFYYARTGHTSYPPLPTQEQIVALLRGVPEAPGSAR